MSKIVDARQHSNSVKHGELDCWRTHYNCHPHFEPMFDVYAQTPHLVFLSVIHLVYAVLPCPMSLVKFGCLKLPSRHLSWLLFLKYPPSRPLSPTHCLLPYLLSACRRSLCFHTPYEDSRLSPFPTLQKRPGYNPPSNCPLCLMIS
jgi:hypothetical protein